MNKTITGILIFYSMAICGTKSVRTRLSKSFKNYSKSNISKLPKDSHPHGEDSANSAKLSYKDIIQKTAHRSLRHVFTKKENKILSIGDMWGLSFTGQAFRNGREMTEQQVEQQIRFKRNLNYMVNNIDHPQFKHTFARQVNTHLRVTFMSGIFSEHFVLRQSRLDINTLKLLPSAAKKEFVSQKTKCFNRVVYQEEAFMVCVETRPTFNFQYTIQTELLVLIRCSLIKFYCKTYKFSYGAHALFFWVFQRYFWKDSECALNRMFDRENPFKATADSSVTSFWDNIQSMKNFAESNEQKADKQSSQSEHSEDVIKLFDEEDFEASGERKKGAHEEGSRGDVMNRMSQVFDYCFLKNILFTRISKQTISIGYLIKENNEVFNLELDLLHEREIVEIKQGKEVFIQSLQLVKIHRIGQGLMLCELESGFILVDETQFSRGDIYADSAFIEGKRYFENRRFVSHFMEQSRSRLFIFCVEDEENLEQLQFDKKGLTWRFSMSHKVWQSQAKSSQIVFGIRRKSLFIYGLRSKLRFSRRVRVCVDHFIEWPFDQNCGFWRDISLSSTDKMRNLDVSMFKSKDSILLFLDNKFLSVSFHFPLYELTIDEDRPQLDLARDRPRHRARRRQHLFAQRELRENNRYELVMRDVGKNELFLLVIDVIDSRKMIWNRSTRFLDDIQTVVINQYETIMPNLKGNFLFSDNELFDLKFEESLELDFQLDDYTSEKIGIWEKLGNHFKHLFKGARKHMRGESHIVEVPEAPGQGGSRATFLFLFRRVWWDFYFLIQTDPDFRESRHRLLDTQGAQFVGLFKRKYLIFYNKENFYVRSADFDKIESNLGIFKAKCDKFNFFEHFNDIWLLFCFNSKRLSVFLNKGGSMDFEGPFKVLLPAAIRDSSEYILEVNPISYESKNLILKARSTEKEHLLILIVNVVLANFNKKADTPQSAPDEQVSVVLDTINQWDISLKIEQVLEDSQFEIQRVVVTQRRLFVLLKSHSKGLIGLNFAVLKNCELELMYPVNFSELLPLHFGLQAVGFVNKIEFEFEMYSNTLILLEAVYGKHNVIVYFFPSHSFLDAFPYMKVLENAEKKALLVPWTIKHHFAYFQSQKSLTSSSYFLTSEVKGGSRLLIEHKRVYLFPYLKLIDNFFSDAKIIEVRTQTQAKPFEIRLERYNYYKANQVDFVDPAYRSLYVDISAQKEFPLEVAIDPHMVRGNVFRIQVTSENQMESMGGTFRLKPELEIRRLFRSRFGSIANFVQISLNREEDLVYLYNRNLLWVLDESGDVLDVFNLNKYLISPPYLMQEFRGVEISENTFFNEELSILMKAISNKTDTCVMLYKLTAMTTRPGSIFYEQQDKNEPGENEANDKDLFEPSRPMGSRKLSISLAAIKVFPKKLTLEDIELRDRIFLMSNRQESFNELTVIYWDNFIQGSFGNSLTLKFKKEDIYELRFFEFSFDKVGFDQQSDESEIHWVRPPKAESARVSSQKSEMIEMRTIERHEQSTQVEYLTSSESFDEVGTGAGGFLASGAKTRDKEELADESAISKRIHTRILRQNDEADSHWEEADSAKSKQLLLFVKLTAQELYLEFYEYTNQRFVFLLGKLVNSHESLRNIKTEKIRIFIESGIVRIYVLNRNYHHFVFEFSMMEIVEDIKRRTQSMSQKKSETEESREALTKDGEYQRVKDFIDAHMDLLKTNPIKWKLDLEAEIKSIYKSIRRREAQSVKEGFKEKALQDKFLLKRTRRRKIFAHYTSKQNATNQQVKLSLAKMKRVIKAELEYQLERLYMKENQDVQVYKGNFRLKMFYLNNPFQFSDKSLELDCLEANRRIILAINIQGKKHILQYPHKKPKNYFLVEKLQSFSLLTSRGTISKSVIDSEICGKETKNFAVYFFKNSFQRTHFLMFCKSKRYLKYKKMGFSWELIRVDLMSRLVLTVPSPMISSRYIIVDHCNFQGCLAQRISFEQSLVVGKDPSSQVRPLALLVFFSVGYLLVLNCCGNVGRLFGKKNKKKRQK